MKFRQTITPDEYLEAQRVSTQKKSILLYVLCYQSWIFGVLILVGVFAPWFASHGNMQPWSTQKSSLVLASILTFLIILPATFRSGVRLQRRIGGHPLEDVEIEATNAGFAGRCVDGTSSFMPWSRFQTVVDCRKVLLLGYDSHFIIISKRALGSERLAELRSLLTAHIPSK